MSGLIIAWFINTSMTPPSQWRSSTWLCLLFHAPQWWRHQKTDKTHKIIIRGGRLEFFTIKFRNLVKSFNLHYVCFMDENLTTTIASFLRLMIFWSIGKMHHIHGFTRYLNDGFLTKLFSVTFEWDMRLLGDRPASRLIRVEKKKIHFQSTFAIGLFQSIKKEDCPHDVVEKTSQFHFRQSFF